MIKVDVLLIGSGIMSATFATILKELNPKLKILIVERLDSSAKESSFGLNNAGTGHSGFCELNYNKEKAEIINQEFLQSELFWTYLIKKGYINNSFINTVPHISFVSGKEKVEFLKSRYELLKTSSLFNDMEFSTDFNVIKSWIPLIMEGRDTNELVAATKVNRGKDVDFGNLTNQLINHLRKIGVRIKYNTEVSDLKKIGDKWVIDCKPENTKQIQAKYIFNGAGGYAINILQKSGIKEANGYAGFPVSGEWLICNNPNIVKKHNAKVYGKANIGTPPMSVPHLDTRVINGKKCLLFGPYAGATTKFLKTGKDSDFFKSIRFNNIVSLVKAGIKNIPLTKYLITEVMKNEDKKFESLKEFYPNANKKDWFLEKAGQRVQVINNGVIEFGTEVVVSEDKTFFTILGASPGASTAVSILSEMIEKNMGMSLNTLIPNFSDHLKDNVELFENIKKEIYILENS